VCRHFHCISYIGQQPGCEEGNTIAVPISSQVLSGRCFRGADSRSYAGVTAFAYKMICLCASNSNSKAVICVQNGVSVPLILLPFFPPLPFFLQGIPSLNPAMGLGSTLWCILSWKSCLVTQDQQSTTYLCHR